MYVRVSGFYLLSPVILTKQLCMSVRPHVMMQYNVYILQTTPLQMIYASTCDNEIQFIYDKIAQTGPLTTATHNKFSPEAIKLKAT